MKLKFVSLFIYCTTVLTFSGCGGDKAAEKKDGDSLGMVANTNAMTAPGMTDDGGGADQGYTEEQLARINGKWTLTESGEPVAVLDCNYKSGTLKYTIVQGGGTNVLAKGEAGSLNDSGYFEGLDENCQLGFEFDPDKGTLNVSVGNHGCKSTKVEIGGSYTR